MLPTVVLPLMRTVASLVPHFNDTENFWFTQCVQKHPSPQPPPETPAPIAEFIRQCLIKNHRADGAGEFRPQVRMLVNGPWLKECSRMNARRETERYLRQQRDEERRRSARHLARANVVLTLADQSLTPHSLSLSLSLCAYQLNCRHANRTASAAVVGGQWKDYEERWAAFGDSGVVTMASIPWPPHADRLLQWQIQKIPPGQDRKATVRSAYKKCALRWHPDKFMGKHGGKMSDGEKDAIQARLNDTFQALNASFTAALKGL